MSRFIEGDGENPIQYAWAGNVRRIIRGKRGQRVLRDLVDALLALPQRRLLANVLENADGEVCAIGALAKHKGIPMPIGATNDEESFEGWQAVYEWATSRIRWNLPVQA